MIDAYQRRHWRLGWWSLLVFLLFGIVLEGLHGLKIGLYLNTSNEARRLTWTLAHAHGTLVGLMHLLFASYLGRNRAFAASSPGLASACLTAGGLILPLGFLLGGAVIYDGDPGPGIFLVPVGGFTLAVGVFLVARSALASSFAESGSGDAGPEA